MATIVKVELEGFKEIDDLFRQITNDFGTKDASNIMRNAVRRSMKPVLETAKSLAPKDTGALAASLQIETRKPTRKDKGSKYIYPGDVVIGAVTTASGKQLAKRSFKNLKTDSKFNQIGISSEARAVAMEFGTAKTPHKSYLRPALERNSSIAASNLGESLKIALDKYKAKQAKKVKL